MTAQLPAQDDPYLWLEEVEGERALAWASELSETTRAALSAQPLFEPIYQRNLEILNSDQRLPAPSQMDGYIYNFWRDAVHVRGLWRRTPVAGYREAEPAWETVIDLDQLAADEDENWVWSGANCRYPEYDRCLISLSRGGGDAAVVREFDLRERSFVADGFYVPEAKSGVSWRDRDSVFIGTDFGAGSQTDSGYPRDVRIWQRGTPLAEAEEIFAGARADVSSRASRWIDHNGYREFIVQATSFYTFNYFLYGDGTTSPLELPEDADIVSLIDDQLLVMLKTD
jgi:prolyl oligopeptidase